MMSRRTTTAGFTLVELLVVIGIIAVLISLLLPSLNRARESARQVQCLSNVRQISMAFVVYSTHNRGEFPLRGRLNGASSEDWLWWQNRTGALITATVAPPAGGGMTAYQGRTVDQQDQPELGGVMPYLGSGPFVQTASFLVCPSDDITNRPNAGSAAKGGAYRFSYTMNRRLSGEYPETPKMSSVKRSTEIALVLEEAASTIDDGACEMAAYDKNGVRQEGGNLLNIVHDRRGAKVDNTYNPTLSLPDRKGNVGYVDGHAEYVDRKRAHYEPNINPKVNPY
jgi:prepilin-type N-terminal cleavage/methylation domain-containing protein/prepilin-type processing-associated H-X9-DG protein